MSFVRAALMTAICKPDKKPLRDALDAPDGFLISRHRDYIERAVRKVYPHTVLFRELIDLTLSSFAHFA